VDKKYQRALDAQEPYIPSGTMSYIKACWYGEFGGGKTVLAAKMIRRRGLFIVNDENWIVLKDWPELFDKIELVEYAGPSHLKALGLAKQEDHPRYREFDLFCIDTMSQSNDNYLDFLIDNYTPSSPKLRDSLNPKAGTGLQAIQTPGMPDYHLSALGFRPAIEELTKAPVDVIYNCHLRIPGPMAEDNDQAWRPALSKAVYLSLGRRIQLMGFMERKRRGAISPTISFEGSPSRIAKSQIRALDGKKFEDADEVVKIINEWRS